jgi:hypothetical protein
MRKTVLRLASLGFVACLSACPPPPIECIDGTEEVCDGGALPPDFCNSAEEAASDQANCHLTVTTGGAMPVRKENVYLSRLDDGGVDQDWYLVQMPGGLTPRTLLHVVGGYSAPQTAVNFSLNLFREADSRSVITGVDRHGAGAPRPIDVIVPFGESNARLIALVADEASGGRVRVDNVNPYSLYVEVLENPDSNEPNETTPTPITLAGTPPAGMGTGYLATNDDVDNFSFAVPAGNRQIVYLRITGPTPHPTNPPPPYRLQFTLFDPMNVPIAEGVMANEFLPIDLATARLATGAGNYRVEVRGFKQPSSTLPVRGDLRVQYQVQVQLFPDLDTQEGSGGNDTMMTARPVTMTANGRTTLTGKLSYVADEEWFAVTLPSRGSPATFRYRVTTAMGGGRFEPLSMTPARQVRVSKRVTQGVTAQDRQVACKDNRAVCPRAIDQDDMLLDSLCNLSDPPQCLLAQRNEELPRIANIRNLVGAIPVAPNTPTELLFVFKDEGVGASKYADDRDWTIELEYFDDADEAGRLGGPTMGTLSGTTSVVTGELTFGHGRVLDPDEYYDSSSGLRGIADYDAYDTDEDLFQFGFGGAMGDQAWEVSWDLLHPDGGSPGGDLGIELNFCAGGAATDGGLCAGQQRRIFAFNDASLTPWYLPQSASNGRMLFTKTSTSTTTTITANPVGCWCFSAARTAPGFYFANVAAVHRTSNDPIRYRINQRISPYPGLYVEDGGAVVGCPVTDGGCGFAR